MRLRENVGGDKQQERQQRGMYTCRQQLPVKFLLLFCRVLLIFFPNRENKLVRSRFFLPLEPWTITVLLCTIPNLDVLGQEPNIS